MERADRSSSSGRLNALRAHAYDPMKRHGFIDSQKMGLEVFRGGSPSSSHRCRIGLAIQPTFASGLQLTRTHPDRRQLEWHLARLGRDAQSQWLTDQDGSFCKMI